MVNKTNVKIIIIIIIIIILILIIILMIMMTMTMMLMMMMMMMMMLLMMVFYSDFHYNMDLHLILRGTIEIYDTYISIICVVETLLHTQGMFMVNSNRYFLLRMK